MKGTSIIGTKCVEGLLEKTGTSANDIDLIICATVTPDMFFPSTANLIANNVGANNSYGFDLSAACSGFLYALATGSQFIESGAHKKVIVIGADKMSSIIDYTERKKLCSLEMVEEQCFLNLPKTIREYRTIF